MEEFKPKLDKRWDISKELELIELWEKEGIYKFDENKNAPVFSIDTPPPYASGPWHIGGVVHYSQIDMIARYKRMKGYNVLFPMGIDRNGLPIEVEAEKKFGINMENTPREEFIKKCSILLDENTKSLIETAKRVGMSCNSFSSQDNLYYTDSPEYRAITQRTLIECWKKGLIYLGKRISNWCSDCKTTIADAEVEYEERETNLVYIKFKIKQTNSDLIIATTRPELLASCKAIIVHPEDERYKNLHGLIAIVPIFNEEVPIIPHPAANIEFGTGAMMVCSFGDLSDIRLFRELKLKPKIIINPDGRLNENAGKFSGLKIEEARNAIIKELKDKGLILKEEKRIHSIPVCWRSHTPIEFIEMEEYYLKQLDFLNDLRKIIDEIKFYPPENKQILINWINSIQSDWPISRRRFYGTELPIWYCKNCGKAILPEPGKYYQPWKENPPFNKCPYCNSNKGFIGETRTVDTWIDSSISSLYILKYGKDDDFFKKNHPCSLRPQGKEIVRTWLWYSLLRVYQLLNKPAFKEIWISGLMMDEKGEKMSKSKGNIVDPIPLFKKYGASAIRLWGAGEASLGSDLRFSEERIKAASKFIQKIWNIARFISQFPIPEKEYKLNNTDKWILAELSNFIKIASDAYEKYDFQPIVYEARAFIWHIFADHYLEIVKRRAYNRNKEFPLEFQKGAWYTMHIVLKNILLTLAPIEPFSTDAIWRVLYSKGESIHINNFPKIDSSWESDLLKLTQLIINFNSTVWKFKKEINVPLPTPIEEIYISENLEKILPKDLFEEIIKTHNIKKIFFGIPKEIEKYVNYSFKASIDGKEMIFELFFIK